VTILGLFTAHAHGQVVVNFDDRPGMPPPFGEGTPIAPQFLINSQYSAMGVFFNSGGGGIALTEPANPVSPPNCVSATAPGPVLTYAANAFATATFSLGGNPAVVSTASLTLTGTSSTSLLQAFSFNGQLLGSVSGGASATLTVSFPGQIHSVRLSQGPFAFDDFTFSPPVVVPEPCSLIFTGAGVMFGFGWRRRRGVIG
jgi:hypothetical protein